MVWGVILLVIEFIVTIVSLFFAILEGNSSSKWITIGTLLAIIVTYFFTPVPAPVIYPVDGQLLADGVVEIRTDTRFSDIYYSLDRNTDPKTNGKRYDGVIRLNGSTTVLARARFLGKWSELKKVEMQFPENSPASTVTLTTIPPVTVTATPTAASTAISGKQTGEISDSWAEILAAIDDGSAQQRYSVGSWKPLSLGVYGTVNMQLAGFNLDDRADGRGKAATTWIAKELLLQKHVMCEETKNWRDNGWKGSDLRYWLNEDVLSAFPYDLRDRLIPVKKQQLYNGANQTTEDVLWIPDYFEVFGSGSLYYGLFQDRASSRVKTHNGSDETWWLRSVENNGGAYIVHRDGDYHINGINVFNAIGVALGFCL